MVYVCLGSSLNASHTLTQSESRSKREGWRNKIQGRDSKKSQSMSFDPTNNMDKFLLQWIQKLTESKWERMRKWEKHHKRPDIRTPSKRQAEWVLLHTQRSGSQFNVGTVQVRQLLHIPMCISPLHASPWRVKSQLAGWGRQREKINQDPIPLQVSSLKHSLRGEGENISMVNLVRIMVNNGNGYANY